MSLAAKHSALRILNSSNDQNLLVVFAKGTTSTHHNILMARIGDVRHGRRHLVSCYLSDGSFTVDDQRIGFL